MTVADRTNAWTDVRNPSNETRTNWILAAAESATHGEALVVKSTARRPPPGAGSDPSRTTLIDGSPCADGRERLS